jgi:hypothetical protein
VAQSLPAKADGGELVALQCSHVSSKLLLACSKTRVLVVDGVFMNQHMYMI